MWRNKLGFISFFVVLPLVLIAGFGVLFTGLAIKAAHCEKITGRHHDGIDEAIRDCKP